MDQSGSKSGNHEPGTRMFKSLAGELKGDLYFDYVNRLLYATDASAYREIPMAVARPADVTDIVKLVKFAAAHQITLIPRTAGTSLAGQVVGNGLVVDVSKYMTKIVEVDSNAGSVVVQPGVVLDELNMFLQPTGLFFAPETSTSNRCMLGGMVGNNACGAHSLVYGSTRDHLISLKAILSDGSEAEFMAMNKSEFLRKTAGSALENKLYRNIYELLSPSRNQEEIRKEFPDPAIKRRNTGYALDLLLETSPFTATDRPFNFSTLLAGSEGTLAFITEIRLSLVPLRPRVKGLICAHFHTLEDALQANLVCLQHNPVAVELMDKAILDCTRTNIEQRKNRFFLKGDPGAILIVEFACDTFEELSEKSFSLETDLKKAGLGYHFPLLTGNEIDKVWALRKSGLGALSNMPGDAKPVSLVEDTAVRPDLLPDYIHEFKNLLKQYNLTAVYHAHVGTGELHMRPVLNLKDPGDVVLFRKVASDVAHLVKRFRGSISGEHGDGRLRGEFIPVVVGSENYELMRQVKLTWDPQGVFNAGKITDTPPMDKSLRYQTNTSDREFRTIFDFSASRGMIRHIEQCNGSGDCRKSALMGGTMCPSYMATLNEHTTTRARANILREYMHNGSGKASLTMDDVYHILDLCLACKGCKSECPSNVDMAKLKSEFLQHYHDKKGIPLSTWLIGNIARIHKLNTRFPWLYNAVAGNRILAGFLKDFLGFARERRLPLLSVKSFEKWLIKNNYLNRSVRPQEDDSTLVYLFLDEFTNYLDAGIGIAAVKLLTALGYHVQVIPSAESGRTYISKGLLRKARQVAEKNVKIFGRLIRENKPLLGVEPSAILTFRDEYPELVSKPLRAAAHEIATHCLMVDEFLAEEFASGKIDRNIFTTSAKHIKLHGHCQQKSIASTESTRTMLTIPVNYTVEEIRSGCCGMAGSFGYEKEHYELSMKIGELVLFPAVRSAGPDTIICATGTSCRDQIADGTGVKALHPVEILYLALRNDK
jgi:FAD/FMN-containing dehydrogenase/Fe-S oxidoreductase